MRARDIMTETVHTIGPDATVAELAALLLSQRISGAPVLDERRRLVGIVSEGDLLRRAEIGTDPRRSWWLTLFTDPDRMAREYVKSHGKLVREIMTTDVVTVREDTPIAEVAALLERRAIKRVPVMRRGRVVGVISRANLVQGLVSHGPPRPARSAAGDRVLRERLVRRIRAQPWAGSAIVNVLVAKQVAHLWGLVRSEDERRALVTAAELVDGIKAVEDHLTVGTWSAVA